MKRPWSAMQLAPPRTKLERRLREDVKERQDRLWAKLESWVKE